MKRSVFLSFVIFCAFSLLLVGCAQPEGDPFSAFRFGFRAAVTGELNGVAFSAEIEADAVTEGGVLPLTVTFYAPSGLSDTVLHRDAEGKLSISAGEASFVSEEADFSALFALFPVTGEVTEVGLDEAGRTQVIFAGGCLLLLPDGTPFYVQTADGEIRILRWEKG